MIDTGATCNFLSETVAQELKLEVMETPEYTVEVGNGQIECSSGVCKDVALWVHSIEIKQSFFLLDLGGTDIILGVDWPASLRKAKSS